jgi:lysophospholipase L1-like esterase
MDSPILLVMLVTTLILYIIARLATDAIIQHHYEQKADFFRHFPVQPGDIVFVGDSITDGGNWEEIFPHLRIKNRGINADTTIGVLRRLGEITAGKPSTVFLLIGTNDLAWLAHRNDQDILSDYAAILERLRAETPETRVYVQSILPRTRRFTAHIRRFNAQLKQLAERYDCGYIDLYPHFAAPDGTMRTDLSNDRLHLLGAGYQVWAGLLAPVLPSAG